jgi:hypothetical protein
VLALDAFSRCWVQEGLLLERVEGELEGEGREAMRALARAWNARNLAVFEHSLERMAEFLARAALEREPLTSKGAGRSEQRRAMEALAARLEAAERELWDRVISAHGLEGRAAVELAGRMELYAFEGLDRSSPGKGALIGGALSGALGGLAADLLSGGLTFGGGLVAGALLGALGGAGLSRGYQLVQARGTPQVRWSAELLEDLARRTALRYLAVAHSGRGRGPFEEGEPLSSWKGSVASAFAARAGLGALLKAPQQEPGALARDLRAELRAALVAALVQAYPRAAALLG